MNTKYDKPFKTFDELALYLEMHHGLTVKNGNVERKYISDMLRIIPYYDVVNGYKDCFMSEDRFLPGIRFSDLQTFYSFDRGFQNVLFPFSIMVEDYFKNTLAYILARDFGVAEDEYLDKKNYVTARGNLTYSWLHNKICRIYSSKNPESIEEPTRHYVCTHNHIPPWILLKNVTFSNAINLFELLKPDQKKEIAEAMVSADIPVDQKIQVLVYALTLIRKCRNRIAHNLKFISFEAKKYSVGVSKKALAQWIPTELISKSELYHGQGVYDIYAYFLFSAALIPDCLHKLLLTARLSAYLGYFSDSSLANLWAKQFIRYAQATNLPMDLHQRLVSYQRCVGNHFSEQVVKTNL